VNEITRYAGSQAAGYDGFTDERSNVEHGFKESSFTDAKCGLVQNKTKGVN
jgi:hypothetical protein